jgi:hypothetical protein
MSKVIKNISGSQKVYAGVVIEDQASYTITLTQLPVFKANTAFITDLTNSLCSVNNLTGANGVTELHSDSFKIDSSEKTPTQKALPVSVMRAEGSSATLCTHDFTNKSTWYQGAVQVTGEALTANGLVYSGAHNRWIDLEHGKVYDEHSIADKKRPKIYVDAVEMTTGFVINYENGTVTFDNTPSGVVTADYWYGNSSVFKVAPTAGKVLIIEHAELNFTKDVSITSPINFQVWVYNPADLPNKVPYQTIKYKNMKDIVASANLGQGFIPAVDIFANDILIFPFNYATIKPFQSSLGAELRLSTDGDEEFGGEWGTCTFYILSRDE